jgi:hypothetical protein
MVFYIEVNGLANTGLLFNLPPVDGYFLTLLRRVCFFLTGVKEPTFGK